MRISRLGRRTFKEGTAVKVFIWVNPYHISYGGVFLFAVAEDEAAARELIAKETPRFAYGNYPEKPLVFTGELGPPDRVIDAPYAEVYEWQE
jgi:hypothetical protein